MNTKQTEMALSADLTLPAFNSRALFLQLALLTAAVALPSAAHLISAPVRVLLPMYWPVLLAGLVYGWRGGLLIGFCAPLVSHLVTGMPRPHILPAMTVELGALGFWAGFLCQTGRWNRFAAATAALLVSRLLFVAVASISGAVGPLAAYLPAALLPGLPGSAAMAVLLPLLARRWVAAARPPERLPE